MDNGRRQCFCLLLLVAMSTGCGLNSAVLKRGASCHKGVLLNYSCGARTCDALDPSKPTLVITHGWNPLPNQIRTTFAKSGAEALRNRCGDSFNLLSWDWNAVRVSPFKGEPYRIGRSQGEMLARALRAQGIDPGRTQIVGHSLGALVAAQAAVCLSDLGPMSQLTLLDPPTALHEEIFCKLKAQHYTGIVENYWAPGCSGYGSVANFRGVKNYAIERGRAPIRGVVDLSVSNHVYTMLWYYYTMCDRSELDGFQNSVLRDYCGNCENCGNTTIQN